MNRWQTRHYLFSALLSGGFGWLFLFEWIPPLRERDQANQAKMAALLSEAAASRRTIQEIQTTQRSIAAAQAELDRWSRERPAGSAMVWFPDRISAHFKSFGVTTAVTRLNTITDEPELPGFQRSFWAVELPLAAGVGEISRLLLAVSELEQAERHLRVLDFAIRPASENPPTQTVVLNCSTLARQ